MRRFSLMVSLALAAQAAAASPAAAHGVGERSDLPLPLAFFTWGAAIALIISFVALRALWPRPRFDEACTGRPLPAWAQAGARLGGGALRFFGLAFFLVTLTAAWFGGDSPATNIAPVSLYVIFWVGAPIVVAVLGDVWSALDPFATLAGAIRWGRGWLRYGEGFAALFGLIAKLSPFFRAGDGRMRLRMPLSGLADVPLRPGLPALILVALGSTGYDGLSGTRWWADLLGQREGWDATVVATLGLVWTIVVVAAIWYGANTLVGRIGDRKGRRMAMVFAPSLIPIVLAYSIAHYFSLLVFEGQDFAALASDPYGQGWNLFGTATNTVNYTAVSTTTIAYVQAAAIVLGHILGVVAAHDRSVTLWDPHRAERTQYPLLFVMIAYTVGGLAILLGA